MKKRCLIGAILLLSVCLFVFMLVGVANQAQEQKYDMVLGALDAPVSTLPEQEVDINLKIDAESLVHSYNARQISYPLFTADIAEPRVEYFWYQKRANEYVAIDAPPTYVGEYRVTVRVADEMDYIGEDTVDFTISPAVFNPQNAEFQYTGASVFSVAAVSAYGTDKIGYEVAFQSGNVGAEIAYITLRGDHAENYRISEDFCASIMPLSVDISSLDVISAQKSYDATDLLFYTFTSDTLPGILRGESATVVFSTGIVDVCDATVMTASVLRCENSNYRFSGEVDVSLSVTKAVFTPPTEIAYKGTETITIDVQTGLGEDVLTLTLVFENAGVGSALSADGASFLGDKAGNYLLVPGYTAQIVPVVLDLSAVGVLPVQKRFDGTNTLSLSLSNEHLDAVVPGETLILTGVVSQIYPCRDVVEVLQITAASNANYLIENDLTVCLTVQKALLVFSGSPEFSYNGYSERILNGDASYISGWVADRPVAITAVFESGAPGAEFLRISIRGEYSELYEVDDTVFSPVIKLVTLGFTVEELSFAANGSDTRVLHAGRSVYLTTTVQSDDVFVVLSFSSSEAGAELVGVTLGGTDAHKYVLDAASFSAIIA